MIELKKREPKYYALHYTSSESLMELADKSIDLKESVTNRYIGGELITKRHLSIGEFELVSVDSYIILKEEDGRWSAVEVSHKIDENRYIAEERSARLRLMDEYQ